ncbi:hypothetical protein, partial [Streptomyces sp. 8L]|uniref:hypothetical protein n=1 Tax=Streptomyces sp. 8L TaxID=2877242 RepID=UPI001CD476E5
ADVGTELETAAEAVPEIETIDAETTEVSQELEEELARTAREPVSVGGRGGTGGEGGSEPPTGGDGDPVPGEDPQGPEALAKKIDPDNLKMTKTVENHFNDITKSGQPARPFMKSNQLVREIMEGGKPTADPRGLASAVRWDTPGALNGKEGTWELLIDSKTNTILHFNFVR